jgi:ABC-type multidrug transport system permease subunit
MEEPPDREESPGKRMIVIIIGMIVAYFLANAFTSAILSPFRLDVAVEAVAGFLLFAIFFLLILKGLEKVSGMVLFAFNFK